MPAARAAWIVASLSCSSAGPYMPDFPMQPRPTGMTVGPLLPSVRGVRVSPPWGWGGGSHASTRHRAGLRRAGDEPSCMADVTASRTLVKSPPELWTECSRPESLARHLDSFGEIRITRLEPESTVAWEGEQVSGTVQLEPSGWGTRVTLTVQ